MSNKLQMQFGSKQKLFIFISLIFIGWFLYNIHPKTLATESDTGSYGRNNFNYEGYINVVYDYQTPIPINPQFESLFRNSLIPHPTEIIPLYPGAQPVCQTTGSDPEECQSVISSFQKQAPPNSIWDEYLVSASSESIDKWYQDYFSSSGWLFYGLSNITEIPENMTFVNRNYVICTSQNRAIVASYTSFGSYNTDKKVLVLTLSTVSDPQAQSGLVKHCGGLFNQCQVLDSETEKIRGQLKKDITQQNEVNICDATLCERGFQPFSFEELAVIDDVLEILPECTKTLMRQPTLTICGVTDASDMCVDKLKVYAHGTDETQGKKIIVCNSRWESRSEKVAGYRFIGEGQEFKKEVLLHELGHALHSNIRFADSFQKEWFKAARYKYCIPLFGCFADTPFPTDYAQTDIGEDIAESFRLYVTQPDYLKSGFQERYTFLKDNVFCGNEYQR